jgi:hypothetical protein
MNAKRRGMEGGRRRDPGTRQCSAQCRWGSRVAVSMTVSARNIDTRNNNQYRKSVKKINFLWTALLLSEQQTRGKSRGLSHGVQGHHHNVSLGFDHAFGTTFASIARASTAAWPSVARRRRSRLSSSSCSRLFLQAQVERYLARSVSNPCNRLISSVWNAFFVATKLRHELLGQLDHLARLNVRDS